MYILTDKQMRKADEYTITESGVPSATLMNRAGLALAQEAEKMTQGGKILCVCGGGNNGGDGFVCARELSVRGFETEVLCRAEKFSEDCARNKEEWLKRGGKILTELQEENYALVIDCLVGTGLKGALRGETENLVNQIEMLRKKGAKVLSADIPSGVCGENGLTYGKAVHADKTLCIGERKVGAFFADGLDCAGEVLRADIGIKLPEKEYAQLLDGSTVCAFLPVRRRNSHKGSYGKVAIVGGSIEYTGAPYLSACACLRSGAGYTTLFIPKNLLPYYIAKQPELLLKSTNDGDRYVFGEENLQELCTYDSVAFGMGMGVSKETYKGVKGLLERYTGKLVLDADGLNSLAVYGKEEIQSLFAKKKCDVVLTPHCKEFFRLSGKEMKEIQEEGIYAPQAFAKSLEATVLLKSASSVITDGVRTFVNATGNSGQAKGGSGDVLAGVIAGLCGSGASAFYAACAGAYLVGLSAEEGVKEVGEYALTATDIIKNIGKAFLKVLPQS